MSPGPSPFIPYIWFRPRQSAVFLTISPHASESPRPAGRMPASSWHSFTSPSPSFLWRGCLLESYIRITNHPRSPHKTEFFQHFSSGKVSCFSRAGGGQVPTVGDVRWGAAGRSRGPGEEGTDMQGSRPPKRAGRFKTAAVRKTMCSNPGQTG